MSRIGRKPILVPEKVDIQIKGANLTVKGPKGELNYKLNEGLKVAKEGNTLVVTPSDTEDSEQRSLWGLSRTLVQNMVTGVTLGFTKSLEFNGVGYKAQVNGPKLVLNLGYSHPIEYAIPQGITIAVKANVIDVSGADKELVGFVAAKIRDYRKPEPYKGKGIKYVSEVILRKAGKTSAKK